MYVYIISIHNYYELFKFMCVCGGEWGGVYVGVCGRVIGSGGCMGVYIGKLKNLLV